MPNFSLITPGAASPAGFPTLRLINRNPAASAPGQVLTCPYPADKARLVVQEMADLMALDLVEKGLVTDQLVLTVGYDIDNLTDPAIRKSYHGPVTTDCYGRQVPKHAHGTQNLSLQTSSARLLTEAALRLYDRIINPHLLVRRFSLTANNLVPESERKQNTAFEQMDLFTDYAALEKQQQEENALLEKEKKNAAGHAGYQEKIRGKMRF